MIRRATAVLAVMIFMGSVFMLAAEEAQQNPQARERLRETLQIRQQMREIEKDAVQNDAELKSLQEELRTLSMKMREKLNTKLSGNVEYQELKKKNDEITAEWKKNRPEGNRPAFKEGKRDGERRKKAE
ncbi:MAG TPA: hypothetical protein PKN36_03035 [bacterium]|nr:hypothetical protein [bacterium]